MNAFRELIFRWRVIWYCFPYTFALLAAQSAVQSTANTTPYLFTFFTGLIISIAGQALRIWGAGYVEKVARKNTVSYLPLITHGPYYYVRHPLYLGNILGMTGFAISAAAFLTVPASIVVILINSLIATGIILLIIQHEEPALLVLHDDVYVKYKQLTPQLLPAFKTNKINTLDKSSVQKSFFSWAAAIKNESHVIIFKSILYLLLWYNLPV